MYSIESLTVSTVTITHKICVWYVTLLTGSVSMPVPTCMSDGLSSKWVVAYGGTQGQNQKFLFGGAKSKLLF